MTAMFLPRMPPTESLGYGRHKTLEDWTFVVERGEIPDIIITVPKGFVTDFFSVPSLCTPIVPRDGASNIPALIHDMLYATVGYRPSVCNTLLTRKECDDLLLDAMERTGFGFWKRRQIYFAVRCGGWKPYGKLAKAGYTATNPMMT